MITKLIEAFILGIIGGAVPGPILTGTFTEILRAGFLKGLRIIFYALFAETLGALIVLYVFYKIGFSEMVLTIISVLGSIVLFWLAYQVYHIDAVDKENQTLFSFGKILLLTALNSGYWIFWITVAVPKALALDSSIYAGRFIYLFMFEFAWLVITVLLAFVFYKFRPLLQKKNLVGITFKILALILVLLAIKTIIGIF